MNDIEALEGVISAVLDVLAEERRAARPGALERATQAEQRLRFAARRLHWTTDALPAGRQPKEWLREAAEHG